MAWTFTRAQLEADRDRAAAEAADYPNKVDNQQLGRALRWLDHDEAAVHEAFRGGAAAMQANVFAKGRSQNAAGWREYGHLLRGAGDQEAAREYFERALTELGDEQSARAAELRYLLGQPPGAAPDGPLWEQALNALHSGEGREEALEAVIGALQKERGLPSYTAPGMTLWDLLEALYGPELTHAEMLERSGLLSG
jgi:tetratricopeptide (TPR) repeat protein